MVREASFRTAVIPFESHQAWFKDKLSLDRCEIFIAVDGGGSPAGVLRFELTPEDDAVISITVEPGHRGKGYAAAMIKKGCKALAARRHIRGFIAEIKDSHEVSKKSFARAGFKHAENYTKEGVAAVKMTKAGTPEANR